MIVTAVFDALITGVILLLFPSLTLGVLHVMGIFALILVLFSAVAEFFLDRALQEKFISKPMIALQELWMVDIYRRQSKGKYQAAILCLGVVTFAMSSVLLSTFFTVVVIRSLHAHLQHIQDIYLDLIEKLAEILKNQKEDEE